MKQIGGIYIFNDQPVEDATVFGVYIGRNQVAYLIAGDHMYSFYQDVENGSMNDMIHMPEYTFGINKTDNSWRIKNESLPKDKSIIASGTFEGRFGIEVFQFLQKITGV